MIRTSEITVSMDLSVQPKQFNSVKLGLSVTLSTDEGETITDEGVKRTQQEVSQLLRAAVHEEVERIYGTAVADYVLNQNSGK